MRKLKIVKLFDIIVVVIVSEVSCVVLRWLMIVVLMRMYSGLVVSVFSVGRVSMKIFLL